MTREATMPVWFVRATWNEEEAEEWEVNAVAAHCAVRQVRAHIRFQPHHIEARMRMQEAGSAVTEFDLQLGRMRRFVAR
jgi:hypothetical protein